MAVHRAFRNVGRDDALWCRIHGRLRRRRHDGRGLGIVHASRLIGGRIYRLRLVDQLHPHRHAGNEQ